MDVIKLRDKYQLITTMLSNHSPEKQNRSPSPNKLKSKRFNQKITNSQNEVFDFDLCDSITHEKVKFNSEYEQLQGQFKLMDCVQDKEISRVKALLSDNQFELKKLQQDFAEYKVLSRIQRQKAVKKLREELEAQKKKNSEEIKKWELNFEETEKRKNLELCNYKHQLQIYYKSHQQKQLTALREKYEKLLKAKEQNLQTLQRDLELACKNLKQQHLLQIKELKLTHQKQAEELKNLHKQDIKKTQQHFEQKFIAVECQKEVDIKLVEEMKKQTVKKEEKYLTQIGIIQREKQALRQKNDQLQMKCKVLTKRLDSKQQQMEDLINQHKLQINQLNAQLQKIKKGTQNTIQLQKLNILKEQYQKTQKIYLRLQKLQQLKEGIIQCHKKNQKLLQQRYQRRQSKREDIEMIREIEGELAHKEKEANQLFQNLKIIQLQKLNDDKIYTRIFTANRKRKSSASRNDRDIYSLLKQSHTTDFRHLLKITKKDDRQTKR